MKANQGSALRSLLVVSRIEMFPAAIGIMLVPAFLALVTWQELLSKSWIIVLLLSVWWLSHFVGAMINSISDVEEDSRFKSFIPEAINRLGIRPIKTAIVIESALAFTITILLAFYLSQWILPVLWVVGLAFSFTYSYEPRRYKARGIWGVPVNLMICSSVLPSLFAYMALATPISGLLLVILALYAVQFGGLTIAQAIGDFKEDKEFGVRTPVVNWGVKKASLVSLLTFLVVSPIILITAFFTFGFGLPFLISLPVFLFAYAIITRDLWRIYSLVRGNVDDRIHELKALSLRKRVWFAVMGLPLLVISFLSLF